MNKRYKDQLDTSYKVYRDIGWNNRLTSCFYANCLNMKIEKVNLIFNKDK